jgi:hypothetical protein
MHSDNHLDSDPNSDPATVTTALTGRILGAGKEFQLFAMNAAL